MLNTLAERFFANGPQTEALETECTEFWAEARNAQVEKVTGQMSGPNVYRLTVDTGLAIAQHCMENPNKSGYLTPSMLMGSDFFSKRPSVQTSFFY